VELILGLLGLPFVIFSAYDRFSNPPLRFLTVNPDQRPQRRKISEFLYPTTSAGFAPPPRSHTTAFKFRLFTWSYVLLWSIFYLLLNVDAVRAAFLPFFTFIAAKNVQIVQGLQSSSPIMVALVVSYLLPKMGARFDWPLRDFLYRRAFIPGERIALEARLKDAIWFPPTGLLASLRGLDSENTVTQILKYEQRASTISLWSKAYILVEKIRQNEDPDIATALGEITSKNGSESLSENVFREVEELKKLAPGVLVLPTNTPEKLEFRKRCAALLRNLYELISRLALSCKSSEIQRLHFLRDLGFRYRPMLSSPMPNVNDFTWFLIIVVLTASIPIYLLLQSLKDNHPLTHIVGITLQILTATLMPVVLSAYHPRLLARDSRHPPVFFPVLSGLLAGGSCVTISLCEKLLPYLLEGLTPADSLGSAWGAYSTVSYPYTILLAGTAVLLSWCFLSLERTGTQRAAAKIVNMKDGFLFLLWGAAINLWIAFSLSAGVFEFWGRLTFGVIVVVAIGLFVPTWFRNSRVEHNPHYDRALGQISYGMSIAEVKDVLKAHGTSMGERSSQFPVKSADFLGDSEIARAEKTKYFVSWRPTSDWILIVGFDANDKVVFRSAGEIKALHGAATETLQGSQDEPIGEEWAI
jgi:hypothetical protein